MKKKVYSIITLLLTVSILTVSASASFSSCSPIKENYIWKCLMMGQTTCLNKAFSVICNQAVEKSAASPTVKVPCTQNSKEQPSIAKLPCTEPAKTQTPTNLPCTQTPKPSSESNAQPPATNAPSKEAPKVESPATEPKIPQSSLADQTISAYEAKVIDLINKIRVNQGLSPLTANADLCRVARYKAQDMVDKHYFSHTSPTYGSPFDMMKTFGISYRTAGENIAYGYSTPESVVEGWMNSEGHRKNILNPSFTQIGVGYVSNGHYWSQMFIG